MDEKFFYNPNEKFVEDVMLELSKYMGKAIRASMTTTEEAMRRLNHAMQYMGRGSG